MDSVVISRSSGLRLHSAGDIVLCSQARHFTVTVLFSPPRCMNGATSNFNAGGNLQKQDELWPG